MAAIAVVYQKPEDIEKRLPGETVEARRQNLGLQYPGRGYPNEGLS
ncbi:MAG: hypothetical protein ACFB16_26850 [Phormidesmis sp.]